MLFKKKVDGRLAFFLLFFLILFATVLLTSQSLTVRPVINHQPTDLRLLRDHWEFEVYYDRISYFFNSSLPYEYNRVEYPLLGVLYLTVPAIFAHSWFGYGLALMCQNLVLGLALIYLTYHLLKTLGLKSNRLWLFVLPSFVYFLLNRFDIFPVVLAQLAFLLLFKKKFGWSFFVLSLGFLAKGYTMVLFPIFFVYWLNQSGRDRINLLKNKPLSLFALPIIIAVAAVCLWAGWENGLFPYYFQSTRFFSYGTFYVIFLKPLIKILPEWLWFGGTQVAVKLVFFLQILLPLLFYTGYQVFRQLVRNFRQVILWSTVALLLYVFFSPYYSPQWFLWLLPLLLLVADRKKEFILIIAYDLVNYLFYPLAWGTVGPYSTPFDMVTLVRTVLLAIIIYFIGRRAIEASLGKVLPDNIASKSAFIHD